MISIYCIKDRNSRVIYVGSTKNINRRMSQHKTNKNGLFLKHSLVNCSFEILEQCEDSSYRYIIEGAYHLFFKSIGHPMLGKNIGTHPCSETIDKIKQSQKGKAKNKNSIMKMKEKRKEQCKGGKEKDRLDSYNEKRKVRVVDQNGKIYNSLRECERETGCFRVSINKVLSGEFKQTAGFVFRRIYV